MSISFALNSYLDCIKRNLLCMLSGNKNREIFFEHYYSHNSVSKSESMMQIPKSVRVLLFENWFIFFYFFQNILLVHVYGSALVLEMLFCSLQVFLQQENKDRHSQY